ncbi:hypothetical protein HOI26_05115 [Candidatus Woesearchaeota archaeon]|jgi:hypothetical protein|nr:hypothetical protein [Candidatus Woesearchaeota archaeon]MBT5740449.1 hypothetical protein [Candidatus Woesearchaeota archaeon]
MSGLFHRKKKVPKLTLPSDLARDHKALQFPSTPPPSKIIQPDEVKEAAGVRKSTRMPEPSPMVEPYIEEPRVRSPMPTPDFSGDNTLYIKVDVYQRILGELSSLKSDLNNLHTYNSRLQTSEYNEENSFTKLRRSMKVVHDKLLATDKTLFKPQG